jgi:hypothetical protein
VNKVLDASRKSHEPELSGTYKITGNGTYSTTDVPEKEPIKIKPRKSIFRRKDQ